MPSPSDVDLGPERVSSVSCSSVKLCALVPAVGTPYRCRAARLELVAKPATYAARARRHRRLLVGAPRAHLDARPVAGGHASSARRPRRSPSRGCRSRAAASRAAPPRRSVRLDDQQRGVGEVDLALGVAPDVAGEAVRRPASRSVGSSTTSSSARERLVVEAEVLERVERPADAGDHAVPAALGQPPREQLEDRAAVRGARPPAPPAAWSARSGRSAGPSTRARAPA